MLPFDFDRLDQDRRAAGLSVRVLCLEAQVSDSTWRRIRAREGKGGNALTFRRLHNALEELKKRGEAIKRDRSFLAQAFRGYIAAASAASGIDFEDALRFSPHENRPKDPNWLRLSRIRQVAVYLTCIEHDVGASELAKAVGLTKQAISKARQAVEDRRDDPEFDRLIERVGQVMSGRAA